MKIRSDFITNSSSSSFIVVFGKVVNLEKATSLASKNQNLKIYSGIYLRLSKGYPIYEDEYAIVWHDREDLLLDYEMVDISLEDLDQRMIDFFNMLLDTDYSGIEVVDYEVGMSYF